MSGSNRSDLNLGGNKEWETKLRQAVALVREVQTNLSTWMEDENQYDNAAHDGGLYTRLGLACEFIEQELPGHELQRIRDEKKELAGQNYELIGALLKLNADKNCPGNCKLGDGKVTALCWRHKLLQDTLGDELSYADLRADGGLPEARAAEKGGA